ncbi:unnamed protein product [Mytilus coruscus]|uniref:Transposase Tc1-like domain-containing protein n=1 Tax=Mytilus coruscus TaxID=42192 RepID=A0A6J8BU62_MYTCO|nr:unnamed protein product [Mytilus coruscus]
MDLNIPFGKAFPLTESEDYHAYPCRQLKEEFDGSIIPRLGNTIADKWTSDMKVGHTVPIFYEILNIVDISSNRKMICMPDSGSLKDIPKIASKPPILKRNHLIFIDQTIRQDREISAQEVAVSLRRRFQPGVSSTTVKRARRRLGWKHSPTQYCQMIRDDNKPKRLTFALRCIATNENFDNAIFTDETTVKIQTSTKYSFRKDDERVPAKGKPKHPYQV